MGRRSKLSSQKQVEASYRQECAIASQQEFGAASAADTEAEILLQLHYEQCLTRLGQQLATCGTLLLEAMAEMDLLKDVASLESELLQLLVAAIRQSLPQELVLLFVRSPDAVLSPDAESSGSEEVFTLAPTGVTHSQAGVVPLPSRSVPLTSSKAFTQQYLQELQAECPAQLWQLSNGQSVVAWLLACRLSSAEFEVTQPALTSALSAAHALRNQFLDRAVQQCNGALRQLRLICQQQQQRHQLLQRTQELEQTSQHKTEFLANTSHEIRTPLSSILGFTHLLREQGFDPNNLRHQEYLTIILSSGQHLLALINDILDLSKIEANQLDLNWESVDVAKVCQTAIALIREKARDKGLQIRLTIAPNPVSLVADPLRLKQMLFNLLSNAVKFTAEGEVGLTVDWDSETLYFNVWDTGIGISQEHQTLLFRPYSQVHNGLDGQVEGTGLGLALTQKLAELHGGRVEVQSVLNQGSQFTIVLPQVPPNAVQPPASLVEIAKDAGLSKLSPGMKPEKSPDDGRPVETLLQTAHSIQPHISTSDSPDVEQASLCAAAVQTSTIAQTRQVLLVEDNSLNARLLLTYLSKLGYSLVWVKNGTEMWQMLEKECPALILMDICLPGEDGLLLTQRLKADRRYQAIPVIAQTAMAMTGDREACVAAGADAYISKPVDLAMLAQLVAQHIGNP